MFKGNGLVQCVQRQPTHRSVSAIGMGMEMGPAVGQTNLPIIESIYAEDSTSGNFGEISWRPEEPLEIDDRLDRSVAGLFLLPALLKIAPSYATSFLVHTVLILGLAVAVNQFNREHPLELSGGVVVAATPPTLEDVSVDLVSRSVFSELDQLSARDSSSAMSGERVSLHDSLSNELPGWDSESGEGEDYSLAANDFGDQVGESAAGDATKGDARFFGTYANGRKFVFIIDCSGSMSGLRWNLARNELKNSITNLTEDKEFMVLLYNHAAWAMFDQDLNKVDLIEATAANKRRFLYWLSRQRPNGWTRPRGALEVALNRSPDAVFLLSDGELQDDSQQFLLFSNIERESEDGQKRKTPVHTVALDLSVGSQLLEQIAQQNNGIFTHIVTRNRARR